ncbi:MAG: CUAEP/CCAEP-tail radical SAM (seleno)protein, partial [Acidimicrobiia bacterium]
KEINEDAHICFFGLYAPINEDHLVELGADTVLGGEFEEGLVNVYNRVIGHPREPLVQTEPRISLRRQKFKVPDRTGLPGLAKYARLQVSPEVSRLVGYTEASRGCQHLCRHCPVVPVYNGRFVVVQPDIVLEDIRRQVRSGAEHITFGDPDFFNGPTHGLRIARRMHKEFPDLTYDVTIKVEHLAKHAHLLPDLAKTGCVLVTSAVESFDDRTLERFDKHHTRADLEVVIDVLRRAGLNLNPTFVTFTPWTTLDGYVEFLSTLAALDLVDHMTPVQYAIRLLIPAGSKLLELPEITDLVGEFDERELVYPWRHPDPDVDRLFAEIARIVQQGQAAGMSRIEIFNEVWGAANTAGGHDAAPLFEPHVDDVPPRATIPYLTEPWYC